MEELNWAEVLEMGEFGTGLAAEYAAMGGMDPMMAAIFAGVAGLGLLALVVLALTIIARCFVFKKMGNQWYEAIISGHNFYVLVTNAGKPGRWVFAPVLMIVPVVGWVVGGILSLLVWISVNLGLAKKFGKGTGFGVGLTLLPFIFYPILAWGKAKYSRK